MSKEEENDLENLEKEQDNTDPNDSSNDQEPTPPDTESKDDSGTDWEKSYKGLQKTSQKKIEDLQGQIDTQKEEIDKLIEQVESGKTDKDLLTKQLVSAKDTLSGLEGDLESATNEKAKLDARVERNNYISKTKPNLAPFQEFIPEGADLEEFQANVEEFEKSLGVYTDTFMKGVIEGSSPPPPEDEEKVDESEEDRLWDIISRTAGFPDKKKEFDEANEKWLAIQRAKQNT